MSRDELRVVTVLGAYERTYGSAMTDRLMKWIVEGKVKSVVIEANEDKGTKAVALAVDEDNFTFFKKLYKKRVNNAYNYMANVFINEECTFTRYEELRGLYDRLLSGNPEYSNFIATVYQSFLQSYNVLDEISLACLSSEEFNACVLFCNACGIKSKRLTNQMLKRKNTNFIELVANEEFDLYGLKRKR